MVTIKLTALTRSSPKGGGIVRCRSSNIILGCFTVESYGPKLRIIQPKNKK